MGQIKIVIRCYLAADKILLLSFYTPLVSLTGFGGVRKEKEE